MKKLILISLVFCSQQASAEIVSLHCEEKNKLHDTYWEWFVQLAKSPVDPTKGLARVYRVFFNEGEVGFPFLVTHAVEYDGPDATLLSWPKHNEASEYTVLIDRVTLSFFDRSSSTEGNCEVIDNLETEVAQLEAAARARLEAWRAEREARESENKF